MTAWERLERKLAGKSTVITVAGESQVRSVESGGLGVGDRYAIASVSKLFTHALIFQLIDQRKLRYSDQLLHVLPTAADLLSGLARVTVRQLVDQTSGLPGPETKELLNDVLIRDRAVPLAELAQAAAGMKPPTGIGRKAHYSDLNAELLAAVAEHVTGVGLVELLDRRICGPLGLHHTSAAVADVADYAAVETSVGQVHVSRYLAGRIASGGIISTAREQLRFIRAFHTGDLFERAHITNPTFRSIQLFPLKYGAGMMSMEVPRLLSVIPTPQIIGHSGSTGSFAFYCPAREAFIVGTTNTVLRNPYQLIYQALDAF